jgi:hypothetical protein
VGLLACLGDESRWRLGGRMMLVCRWLVNPIISGHTQEDGEKADLLLRRIRDRLREDLVLSVAACIDS